MTEPFVTTEYGVPLLSGKQKGSERLGVTKHYPHSCWLYEQATVYSLPSFVALSSSSTLCLFLPALLPCTPNPVFPSFCHSKNHHHICFLCLIPSSIGFYERRYELYSIIQIMESSRRRQSAYTQSNVPVENSIKSTDTESPWYCFCYCW